MLDNSLNLIEFVGVANPNVLPQGATVFKQLSVMETVEIPEQKPDIEQLLQVSVAVNVFSVRVIETPIAATGAPSGQILTGYKAIIEAELCQKIQYVANEPSQSVHAAHFSVPFSEFIVLPDTFSPDTQPLPKVVAYIEDIFAQQLDERKIFKNITIMLDIPSFCA
jgi:hypothetical protein